MLLPQLGRDAEMNTTIEFLDAVKAKHGITSDYALSPVLGITRSAISKFRNGKDFLGGETAVKVAILLDIDPGIVLAAVAAERAKTEAEKAAWKSIYEKLGGIAAGLVVALALGSSPTPSFAEQEQNPFNNNIHYTKLRKRNRKTFNPILAIFEQFVQLA